jgi:site-specific recombinase XerD
MSSIQPWGADRGLHAFFKWMVAEGDLETNPMERMKPPQLPEQPVEVAGPEHLARLLKTCEGRDFASRRDTAIILLLVDTGMRRAECAGMTPGRRRPGSADCVGAGQGAPTPGAADRPQDRPGTRPVCEREL